MKFECLNDMKEILILNASKGWINLFLHCKLHDKFELKFNQMEKFHLQCNTNPRNIHSDLCYCKF